jgi:hypothetical protein
MRKWLVARFGLLLVVRSDTVDRRGNDDRFATEAVAAY